MEPLPLFRFNIWMDNYEQYNCRHSSILILSLISIFSALGDIDWSSRGTRRTQLGILCVAFGAIAIPAYFACALIMVPMRQLSVYKIMIYLAAVDICDLLFASIAFGFMSFTGQVYCMHPRLQLVYSLGLEFFFFCSTTACALLALNRLGEIIGIRPVESRTWFVLIFSAVPVALLVLFTPPMLFNSTHHMLFFDPMIFERRFSYDSYVHFACVTIMPIASLIMYLAMLVGLYCNYGKKSSTSKALNRATFQISIQSGVIIVIHLTSMLTFQVLQFIPVSAIDTMLYFAHFGWMLVHGTPPLVYLVVNQTIRETLLNRLCPNQKQNSVVSVSSRI